MDAVSNVTSSHPPSLAPTLAEKLSLSWAVRLPKWLDAWSSQLAYTMTDGVWTLAWPKLAAFAPVGAFAVGVFSAVASPGWDFVYTESLPFLAMTIAGAILSGPVGIMLVVGFGVGDFVFAHPDLGIFALGDPSKSGSRILSYLLLGFLAVKVPFVARLLTEGIVAALSRYPRIASVARWIFFPVASGLLVFLWCQAMIVLIRPVFTWLPGGYPPSVKAIQPIQWQWRWLVGAAVVAALSRLVLEGLAGMQVGFREKTRRLEEERWRDTESPPRTGALQWREIGGTVAVATFVLAGFYQSWMDALLVASAVAVLRAWNVGSLGPSPYAWINAMRKVPALIRLSAALYLGYLLSEAVVQVAYKLGVASFRSVLIGVLGTLTILYICFPNQRAVRPAAGDSRN